MVEITDIEETNVVNDFVNGMLLFKFVLASLRAIKFINVPWRKKKQYYQIIVLGCSLVYLLYLLLK